MQLPDYLVEFLDGPAMILLGTRSQDIYPEVGRAVGVRVVPGNQMIDLVVSRWQWPATVANIISTGELAVTVSRPTDYETYQIKGKASLRDMASDDAVFVEGFRHRMSDCLAGLGITKAMGLTWFCQRDAVVVQLQIDAIFVQTPGARAGVVVPGGGDEAAGGVPGYSR